MFVFLLVVVFFVCFFTNTKIMVRFNNLCWEQAGTDNKMQ